jgi:hypothetical protein
MRGSAFLAYSPLEVGDIVLVKGWRGDPAVVTEIETTHRASDGAVTIRHYVDGWIMPLSALECRLVEGRRVPIGTERVVSREAGVTA